MALVSEERIKDRVQFWDTVEILWTPGEFKVHETPESALLSEELPVENGHPNQREVTNLGHLFWHVAC